MVRKFLFLFTAVLIFSCSSDNNGEEQTIEESLIGTWVMTGVNIDPGTEDDQLEFAEQIVNALLQDNCNLIIFTFNANGTLRSEDKVNNLEINAGPNGLEIDCPTTSDVFNTTWTLDGDQVTIIDEDGMEETFTVNLEGNTLIIAGEDVSAENYTGADIVFTKQ